MLSLVWLLVNIASSGILFESIRIRYDLFSNVLLGIANFTAISLVLFLLKFLGRRLTISVLLSVYAVKFIVSSQLLLNRSPYLEISYVISKIVITMVLITLSTYTTEFWPLDVQNAIFNICKMIGRLGSIIAVIATSLATSNSYLAAIFYTSAAILCSILLFTFLPESKDCIDPPEAIDDALAIGKQVSTTPNDA